MPKSTNREYKKGKPFRDARKFFIVCEGEREADYFNFFDGKSRKLVIDVSPPIKQHQGESAPSKLKERAINHIEKSGWDENFNDQLWFVLDVDSWEREAIDSLCAITEEFSNWGIGISNPCFEVWLYYHKADGFTIQPKNAQHMKQILHQQVNGGYTLEEYAPEIETAIVNSESNDKVPQSDFPDLCVTKVYKLAREFINLLEKDDGRLKFI
ncbi:RloB family protein [Fulvivirgaceae bacterium BMA10]|uniref:RloB family protein n=1 Tax=Splendidivirga corallicola TaxID=3051826 RepID=A0ABT8KXM7_9BACT|nr:RloB family protein [Fulvivirgaceae bacterium BMA10]